MTLSAMTRTIASFLVIVRAALPAAALAAADTPPPAAVAAAFAAADTSPLAAVAPAYELLERLIPGSTSHFALTIASDQNKCFAVDDYGDQVSIVASDVSLLAAGIGFYLREAANMTIGWPRGGGSDLTMPKEWPKMAASGGAVTRCRRAAYSYWMNVCTHSYSLVWYGWPEWEALLDWMALSGVNMFLALTGQEEVQYRVLQKFGLADSEIRGWFNGPAFLTWSRGQNEYGAGIAGPLPRSFMKQQYAMQKQILARARSLGLVGQLPGFQGNVPVGLKQILADSNITSAGATGWMDALDPHYGEIADAWMKELLSSFGTDSVYQLDGYFNGGTAPWLASPAASAVSPSASRPAGDPLWKRRGEAVYQALARADAGALWSFQGFAVIGWSGAEKAAALAGFIEAAPKGKFMIIDMDYGEGEWETKFDRDGFWGTPFVWTKLHNFGGTDGLRGNLTRAALIPSQALQAHVSLAGTGFTSEGIDQNPAYYELLLDNHFTGGPDGDVAGFVARRAVGRYRLAAGSAAARAAETSWRLLAASVYSQDVSVQDTTGVKSLVTGSPRVWSFEADRSTPTPKMCQLWRAWGLLIEVAAAAGTPLSEPLSYDLVNTGREVLAQYTTPLSLNFTDAIFGAAPLDAGAVAAAGASYAATLVDLDELVGADQAFLLGSWLQMARALAAAANGSDCTGAGTNVPAEVVGCAHFYEYNARSQLTTWNPTPKAATKVPPGPLDYAGKHWNGLLADYYRERVERLTAQAKKDAAACRPLDGAAADLLQAQLAFEFQVATKPYPTKPAGDALAASVAMRTKYKGAFASCESAVWV